MTLKSLKLGPNVMVVGWVTQNDVLGHPEMEAFVSRAGSDSMYAAAYHAVPMVSMPLSPDQTNNAIKAS